MAGWVSAGAHTAWLQPASMLQGAPLHMLQLLLMHACCCMPAVAHMLGWGLTRTQSPAGLCPVDGQRMQRQWQGASALRVAPRLLCTHDASCNAHDPSRDHRFWSAPADLIPKHHDIVKMKVSMD